MFPRLVGMLPGSHQKVFQNVEDTFAFIREVFTKQKKTLDVNDQRNLIDAFLAKQEQEVQVLFSQLLLIAIQLTNR